MDIEKHICTDYELCQECGLCDACCLGHGDEFGPQLPTQAEVDAAFDTARMFPGGLGSRQSVTAYDTWVLTREAHKRGQRHG